MRWCEKTTSFLSRSNIKCNSKTLYMWNTLSGETVRMYISTCSYTWLHAYVSVCVCVCMCAMYTFVYNMNICTRCTGYVQCTCTYILYPVEYKDCMVLKFLHIRKSQRVAWIAWKMNATRTYTYLTTPHTHKHTQIVYYTLLSAHRFLCSHWCKPHIFTWYRKKVPTLLNNPNAIYWSCERQCDRIIVLIFLV